ncbi:hypothetical protein J3E64_003511 [Sphingobium sp. OAS761]|uniref:hypothetical protein n=1 Tax=Sphingobium sp. OAS761 TaxID=2817901 RepID=UPI00209F1056|nr:hypothetical protein [Sphingobium sp. OAS761]MCP1471798.1 hypothetical protein [Sphingobium sp. OAS761]
MRLSAATLVMVLILAACGGEDNGDSDGNRRPGAVSNMLDQALPNAQDVPTPANAIDPVEPAPAIKTPPPATAGLVPAAFQGRWAGLDDRCGDKAAPMELTIAADELVFHESVGTVKAVRNEADGKVAVDASFTGEGQSWTRSLSMALAAGGRRLTITNDGEAVTRKRC